ncbi:mechanosensitive ion channel family protein [Occultella kanbiaonis]|uniref:mechanosensitive ion channel family protein n=1 Tax=Occultella kanbiaonis TaxID=2675754 RepID=UPI0013D19D9B|nr:mechanosensitive ion channel family protein [Occultella kanbiaonis]
MTDVLGQDWLVWAAVLALGVPVVLVALTEVLRALVRRGHAAAKPVRLLRNWVIPVAALLALVVFASNSPSDQVWARVVATVLGFLVILLLLSGMNVALFTNAASESWRSRLPSIFVDITRLLLVIIGVAVLFQWVWGADVGGLVAALGVTSIVLGLALQNAVGGVISGLLLLFEQPFQIGDTLEAGGVQGTVVEVNWRAAHIDTGAGIQVFPNASLAGSAFRNLSRPAGAHHAPLDLKFATADPPHEVIALLLETAVHLPWRAPDEQAAATYVGSGGYSVSLPLVGPADVQRATSLYLSWLWYAARRRGLALDNDRKDPAAEPERRDRALRLVAQTLQVGEHDLDRLSAEATVETYAAGETVLAAGVVPDRLRFVVSGRLHIVVDVEGRRQSLAEVERGDYVGQMALTREPSETTALADGVVTVLAVPLGTLETFMRERPGLATDLGRSIERRRALVASLSETKPNHSEMRGP